MSDPITAEIVVSEKSVVPSVFHSEDLPALIVDTGRAGETAWDDFFSGRVRNSHTRKAYERAVRSFLVWSRANGRQSVAEITAGDVGRYLAGLAPEKRSIPKKKQHLAGLRKFFNLLVERHLCLVNPAAVAETERFSNLEGKTPIITYKQALRLYESIDRDTLVGKRDLAALMTLNFTGARAGAVGGLDIEDLQKKGSGWELQFVEKNNKVRLIPVPDDLEVALHEWLDCSGLAESARRRDLNTGLWIPRPLFRTFVRREGRLAPYRHERRDPLTGQLVQRECGRMDGRDLNRMMKRRLKVAGLPTTLRPHSYRVAIATDLEDQGVSLETRQHFLGHSDPRTTLVYSRKQHDISRNLVERIRVGRITL